MRVIVKTVLLSFCFVLIFIDSSTAVTLNKILATVNDEIITLSDYKEFLSMTDPDKAIETVDEKILKNLIEEKLILQETKKSGIDITEEEIEQNLKVFQKENNLTDTKFEKILVEEGMTLSEYKKILKENIIWLKVIDKEVNSKVVVTDKDISEYYNKNIDLFIESPEKLRVKAVFLKLGFNPSLTEVTDLKIKSVKIYAEIKNGESFDKIVSLYSDEPLKSRNGMLGEFEKGELLSSLDRKVSEMKEGDLSEPVWTKEGVYILKLIKKTKKTFLQIDKVKDRIHSTLSEVKNEEQFNKWIKSLWEKSSIKIHQS